MEPAAGFFRRQSGRLVSALTRIFGVRNVALAEDVTQDALCRALSVWQFSGVPDDPAAWEQEVHRQRDEDLIVNDDCTLVVVRIGPFAPPSEPGPAAGEVMAQ